MKQLYIIILMVLFSYCSDSKEERMNAKKKLILCGLLSAQIFPDNSYASVPIVTVCALEYREEISENE